MLRTAFAVVVAALLLAACASPLPPPPVLPSFEGASPPAPGHTRLYVFRPRAEGQALHDEQPVLFVNDIPIAAIPENGYADLQLSPGRHVLSFSPPDGGSDLWRSSLTLRLQPGAITYVAFWMAAGFERTPSGNDSADTVLLVLPVGNPEDIPAHLRVERSHPSIAEPILRQCCGRVFPPPADAVPSGPVRRMLQLPD